MTDDDVTRFWALIESAWAACGPEQADLRRALVERDPAQDDDELRAVETWLEPFLTHLRELSAGLSSAELTALDRVLERTLHTIDRAEIHEHTDGSDDGFLYCRGFIVAAGQRFYEAVDADPALALLDAECEEMCYFFAHLHEKQFGTFPETGSGISRETGSNPAGW
ncbi:DUF4240 domain-containing protein [Actinoplanes palleronii]|uniref:DUF4240 domain-containing protein n=1 Tax=Actinoplanes palleronii TaxID=113570 RepID=A0ABQ4BSX8_9ACTN|nr:DUF4240 domain-containing protein [Actinoplanes palleronii]GIE73784.1 hypothetical protein Apa02nite_098920 [Actinoplanes palleronii]